MSRYTITERRYLARHLIEQRPGNVTYEDLADLAAYPADEDVTEQAIKIARDRLKSAADRGNQTAAKYLAGLTR